MAYAHVLLEWNPILTLSGLTIISPHTEERERGEYCSNHKRSAAEHCDKYLYGWHGQNRSSRTEDGREGKKCVGAVAPFTCLLPAANERTRTTGHRNA